MKIGSIGFDNNDYPVKIQTFFGFSDEYEFVGHAENVNIIADGRFGDNQGWELDESHGISKVLLCVKSVSFYDGKLGEIHITSTGFRNTRKTSKLECKTMI